MSDRQPRILIVDDEADACANLADILTDLDYQVDVAYDGPGALELVQKNAYDVALLDLKMPGMDGLELYQRIKSLRGGIVAIVVTAFATSKIAQAALDAGAAEILAKPVDLPHLLRLVEGALDQPLILVVDDDSDFCDSFRDILCEQGYRVSLAHDARAAEEQLRHGGYQVVLIDMKLPQGDGAEVFQLVRQTHAEARTVLITGYRSETETLVNLVLSQGADAVAYKPFDIQHLLGTLNRLTTIETPS